jgi:hypothetical protein
MYRFVFGFACMVTMFWSCSDNPDKLGYDLLPAGDLIHVRADSTITAAGIKAYNKTDGNLRTDEPLFNLLGTYNDPIFGKTTADFALQFRIDSFPEKQNVLAIDSLVLYLMYKQVSGDIVTPQKLKVYELGSDLAKDNKYYQNVDLKGMSKSEVLADMDYIPKFKLDSLSTDYNSTKADPKDTVLQTLRIHLDQSLATKLMAADSVTLSNNYKFLNYFKGLYVEAGDLNSGGAIMNIRTVAIGSKMILFYRTAKDTLKINYLITDPTARVSRFTHDYSKTTFASKLDKEDAQDSLIYLQTTGGLRTKIEIPNLESWIDSADFAINKAELIFTVDPIVSDTAHYPTPEQLTLVAITKSSAGVDSLYYPSDYSFSPTYFGGKYNKSDLTYRFNIANHLQDIIDGKKENLGFYFETTSKSSIYRRIAIKGPTSKKGVGLKVVYSRIK